MSYLPILILALLCAAMVTLYLFNNEALHPKEPHEHHLQDPNPKWLYRSMFGLGLLVVVCIYYILT